MSHKQKILIIEPSIIIREGISSILSSIVPRIKLCFVGSFADVFTLARTDLFNLILINPVVLNNSNANSKKLRDFFNGKILIGLISTHYDRAILKEFNDNIFINDDEETISNTILKNLKPGNKNNIPANTSLSDREIDVLKLLAIGKSNKEIAESLFISIHTVVSHRKNISVKLGVKSTAALVIYAVANNLIKLDEFHQ
ncbi:response regulator transcription factor [Sunxiuqinia sp. A32]|uniref:response regulator transcription factor n=1 Tax=Sunxiuqinia sp. A32 TaxID=3461496 RepID=UPI00404550EE